MYHKNDLQDFFLTTNISIRCVIFMIKTHSKRKNDVRNEYRISNKLENVNHSFYDKNIFDHGPDNYSNMADGGHFEFKMKLVSLDNFFPVCLVELIYQMGHLHHDLKVTVTLLS